MTNTVNSLDLALAGAITKISGSSGQAWDATASTISKAVDVVQAEAPLLIQEFLVWKTIEAGFPLVAALVFFTILIYVAIRGTSKKWLAATGDISLAATFICGLGASLLFTSVILPQSIELTKIKCAPRVYMVEYVATTLKGK